MSSSKVIHALYDDDDVLLKAVKEVKAAHHHIEEVYTPFPVHGLDKAMGLEGTRLGITAFMYGVTGLCFAVWFLNMIMIQDWPQNIGGKPSFAFYMITFYMRSKIWPFREAENPDPRTTDDHFLMEIAVDGSEDELASLLKSTGAVEINVKEKH